MARNDTFVGVPPEAVFDRLAEGWSFARWVAGTEEVRRVEADWPAVGSSIQPTVGLGPLRSRGRTTVEEATPPWHLRLKADAGFLGTADVELQLAPEGRGTRVTLVEEPTNPLAKLHPLVHLLLRLRNVESLRRLKELAEAAARRRPPSGGVR